MNSRNVSLQIPWLIAIIAIAGGMRVVGLNGEWLWYDELLSVNFSAGGVLDTILTVARFDVHPPLYYVQLAFWMAFGSSDAFVMGNSVVWSVLTIAVVYAAGIRQGGRMAAAIAAALVAVSPAAIYFSHQVRMYSFLSFLLVSAFACMVRFLQSGQRKNLVFACVLMAATAYSHAAGILMASGVATYGIMATVQARDWRQFRLLIGMYLLLAILCIPAVAFVANRGINHAVAPGLTDVGETLRFLFVGADNSVAAFDAFSLGVLGLAFLVFVATAASSRMLVATTVVVPIALIFLVSHLVTAIWLDRTVVFVVPFLALGFGQRVAMMADRPGRRLGLVACCAVAALGLTSLAGAEQVSRSTKGDAYRPMAQFVADSVRPGDLLLLDMPAYSAWCFLWYFGGQNWGRPLEFHDVNPTWRRLLDRIGPVWSRRLGWIPSARSYVIGGRTVTATFLEPPPELPTGVRVVVVRQGAGISPTATRALPPPRGDARRFENFTVEARGGD